MNNALLVGCIIAFMPAAHGMEVNAKRLKPAPEKSLADVAAALNILTQTVESINKQIQESTATINGRLDAMDGKIKIIEKTLHQLTEVPVNVGRDSRINVRQNFIEDIYD